MKASKFAEKVFSPVDLLVKLPFSIVVAIYSNLVRVDRNWWHETPGYRFYYDRPDYKRYQTARTHIAKYRRAEKVLLKLRAI